MEYTLGVLSANWYTMHPFPDLNVEILKLISNYLNFIAKKFP